MTADEQLEIAITEAKRRVAMDGLATCDLRHVILAGSGYVADKLLQADKGVIHIKLEGKRMFAVGMLIGGIAWSLLQNVWHFLKG